MKIAIFLALLFLPVVVGAQVNNQADSRQSTSEAVIQRDVYQRDVFGNKMLVHQVIRKNSNGMLSFILVDQSEETRSFTVGFKCLY